MPYRRATTIVGLTAFFSSVLLGQGLSISNSPPSGIVGTPYNFQFSVEDLSVTTNPSPGIVRKPAKTQFIPGPSGIFQWAWFGSIPPGLTLSETGQITGTPTEASTGTGFGVLVNVVEPVFIPPTVRPHSEIANGIPFETSLTGSKYFYIVINAPAAQIQASPASLQFNASANGPVPSAQAVSVIPASGAPAPDNFTIQLDGGQANTPAPAWLSVLPAASGVAPAQVVVSANQGTLAAGMYSGRIRLIDSKGIEDDIAVTLTVAAAPQQLQVAPGILQFAALAQTPGSLTAGLAITAAGEGGPVGFSTSVVGGSSWITGVTPSSGQTAPNATVLLAVTVDTSGLAIGSYRDEILVSSAAGNVNVPVTVFVAESGSILAVNLTGIRLQAIQGGGFSNAQTIQILNLGDPTSTVNWSASLVSPAAWLSLPSTTGTATAAAPGVLTVTLTPSATAMQPGGYYALIKITDANSRNSPQYVLAVLDLESAGSPSLPDPSPAGFFFVSAAGGAPSNPDVLTINTSSASAVPFQVATATSNGGPWLVASPTAGVASGAAPGTVNVSVNPAGLAAGIYTGSVNVSMSGALRTVNVTLEVPAGASAGAASQGSVKPDAASCAASKVVLTETGLVNNFAVPAGWPATLIVQLNDDCGNGLAAGSVVASFSNGDAPLTLAGNGQNSSYSATWQPGSVTSQLLVTLNATSGALQPATVQLNGGVAVNQNQPPVLATNGTLHNLDPVVGAPLAPGTIAEVFGSGLGPPMGVSPGVVPLVNTFDNTYVLIGPYQAPLFYLSSGQLDVQVPAELTATQQYPIVVSVNNAITLPAFISVVPATPGVAAGASGGIVAQHTDFSLVTSANPAKPGEVIVIYLAGLGATDPSVASGQPAPATPPLAQVTSPVTISVGGQNAKVDFAGLTPGAVGLYQVDFEVPATAPNGNLNVVVTQNSITANSTTLPVAN